MVGSPNYIFMVYDGDQSSWPAPAGVPIPEGSVQIEDLFESLYTKLGEPYDDAQFSGRSDYQAFINNGIPSGGLFTGAEVVKTPLQESIWGGTAGQSYDPCYHQACDTIDNLALDALDVNSDVVAAAVLTYAYSTESVNGVKGTKVPGGYTLPAPAGPREDRQPAEWWRAGARPRPRGRRQLSHPAGQSNPRRRPGQNRDVASATRSPTSSPASTSRPLRRNHASIVVASRSRKSKP